ncbi:MAG: hypothetical protein AABX70_06650 [Nanoarchaeota archaeon]
MSQSASLLKRGLDNFIVIDRLLFYTNPKYRILPPTTVTFSPQLQKYDISDDLNTLDLNKDRFAKFFEGSLSLTRIELNQLDPPAKDALRDIVNLLLTASLHIQEKAALLFKEHYLGQSSVNTISVEATIGNTMLIAQAAATLLKELPN